MDTFLQALGSALGVLMDASLFGVPVLLWVIIGCSFTLIGKFIVGKK